MRTRILAASSAVTLLAAAWLALAPFHDREVPCGAPLFGADPAANYSITPGTCSDAAAGRLRIAGLLVGVTVVLVLAAVRTRQTRVASGHQADPEPMSA